MSVVTESQRLNVPDLARVLAKLHFPDGETGCWMWESTIDSGNQPVIRIQGKTWKTRTVLLDQYPQNGHERPLCRVLLCVAPHHRRR